MTATDRPSAFRSLAQLRIEHMHLLDVVDGRDPDSASLGDLEAFLDKARSTGAVLSDAADRRSAQSMLDYWTSVLYRARPASGPVLLDSFDPAAADSHRLGDAECPYPGVRAFAASDAEFYFGRELQVTELAIRLRDQFVLPIIGPRMSGKTSFVAAGLVPALKTGRVPGSGAWLYPDMVMPGPSPLRSLAHWVHSVHPSPPSETLEELVAQLAHHPETLRGRLRQFGTHCLMVVDQLEAAFAGAAEGLADHLAFLDNLVSLAQDDQHPCHLILLARSEALYSLPAAEVLLARDPFDLPALGAREMRDAILQPADAIGLKYDEGVASDLVASLVAAPSPLPVLQFVLRGLWSRRDREQDRVRWATYRELLDDPKRRRAVAPQALARAAGETYSELTAPADRDRARRIFLALVEPGDSWELRFNRVRRAALAPSSVEVIATNRALERFAGAAVLRLTEDGDPDDPHVELTHESLPRYWDLLKQWLEQRQREQLQYLVARAAAVDWQKHGRPSGALWSGSRLKPALVFRGDANPVLNEFVEASIRLERKEHLQRVVVIGTGIALVAIIMVTLYKLADQQLAYGRLANSRDLAAQADLHTRGHLDLQLLLSLNAAAVAPTNEARAALLSALETNPYLDAVVPEPHHAHVLSMSPDGRWLASGNEDGSIDVWDLDTHTLARALASVNPAQITTLAFTPDGASLAVVRATAPLLEFWSTADGRRLPAATQPPAGFTATRSAVSSNGLLALASQRTIQLTPLGDSPAFTGISLAPFSSTATTLAFSPDGSYLAVGGCVVDSGQRCTGGVVQLFDTATATLRATLAVGTEVLSLDVGHSDQYPLMVAAGTGNGSTVVAGVKETSGTEMLQFDVLDRTPAGPWLPRSVAFSSSGRRLTIARCRYPDSQRCQDSDIQMWSTDEGAELQAPIEGHQPESQSLVFAQAGDRVATANAENVSVWDVSTRLSSTTQHAPAGTNPNLLARSPTAPILASPSCAKVNPPEQCGVQLTQVEDGEPLGPAFTGGRHAGEISSLAFDATGSLLASGGADGSVMLWDVAARAQRGDRLTRGTSTIWGLAFGSRSGQEVLAVADDDRKVSIWNVATGSLESELAAADAGLRSVAFSADGALVAAGTDDGRILVWDTKTGDLAIPPLTGHVGSVRVLGFETRNDMRLLASVDEINRIVLWDVDAARPVAFPPNHHDQPITSVEFLEEPATGRLVFISHDIERDVAWTLNLERAGLYDRVCRIVRRNLTPVEEKQYLNLESPFPSSLLNALDPVRPVGCPDASPPESVPPTS